MSSAAPKANAPVLLAVMDPLHVATKYTPANDTRPPSLVELLKASIAYVAGRKAGAK